MTLRTCEYFLFICTLYALKSWKISELEVEIEWNRNKSFFKQQMTFKYN